MERRLAAILAADVAGYSRMMAADETATLVALQRHRSELLQPGITRHHGRVVKLMGDPGFPNKPADASRGVLSFR